MISFPKNEAICLVIYVTKVMRETKKPPCHLKLVHHRKDEHLGSGYVERTRWGATQANKPVVQGL
jgi:hypothetical protein